MDRRIARKEARILMDAAELGDWTFKFDTAKRRAGSCVYRAKTITLSGPLTDLYDRDTVQRNLTFAIVDEVDSILIDEARTPHALVGPDHHHDATWRRVARGLGAPDDARLPSHLPSPDEPWVGTCPKCGAQRKLYRPPRRVAACGHCARHFDVERILTWTYKGHPRNPGTAYLKELGRIERA